MNFYLYAMLRIRIISASLFRFSLVFILAAASVCLGQGLGAQNHLDDQGRKQGSWMEYHANGQLRYEATFKEGYPIGQMKRYSEKGELVAVMQFSQQGRHSFTRLYHGDGKVAAEGIYIDRKKDSVWNYYSEIDHSLRMKAGYSEGLQHGTETHFYSSGRISEEIGWEHGMRQGPWLQYYVPGPKRLEAAYENNELEGEYRLFYISGQEKLIGRYSKGLAEGSWRYFDEQGGELYSLDYKKGQPADMEKYEQWVSDSLMKYEGISLPEPTFEEF